MPDQMFACPQCRARTRITRTRVPTAAFRLGPQTPEMSRPATIIECVDEDCGWGGEVAPITAAAEAAVAQLDADLQVVLAITDENLQAQARAEAEQRFLTTAAGDEAP